MENAAVAMLAKTLEGTEEEIALTCEAVDRAALCVLLTIATMSYIRGGMWAYKKAQMPKLADLTSSWVRVPFFV